MVPVTNYSNKFTYEDAKQISQIKWDDLSIFQNLHKEVKLDISQIFYSKGHGYLKLMLIKKNGQCLCKIISPNKEIFKTVSIGWVG